MRKTSKKQQSIFSLLFFLSLFLFDYRNEIENKIYTVYSNYAVALDTNSTSRFLKTADSPTVYYVNSKGIKLPIPSAKVFLSYGNSWSQVEMVDEKELDFYKNGKYIKQQNDAKVYRLSEGVKRYLTQDSAKSLKIFPEEVIEVNRIEFNAYRTGGIIKTDEALEIFEKEKNEIAEAKTEFLFDQSNQINILNAESLTKCVASNEAFGEDGCKYFYALENSDIKSCLEITNKELKAKCVGGFSDKPERVEVECEDLETDKDIDICFSELAVKQKNKSYCQNILDENEKRICESKVKFANKEEGACDSLEEGDGQGGKNGCFTVIAITQKNENYCKKISDNSVYKKNCEDIVRKSLEVSKVYRPSISETIEKFFKTKKANAQFETVGLIPVGGRFAPGLFDIFTPTPTCGILVTVIGPRPGTFVFLPAFVYDYFAQTPNHIGVNMLGLARFTPPCVPTLFMLGSSLTSL